MNKKWIKLYLRLAIGIAFLSASADRLGIFGPYKEDGNIVAWGDWSNFVDYTQSLLPWLSENLVQVAAIGATVCEIVFGILLILGVKVRLFANLSGVLLLLFALAMLSVNIKSPFDASVFAASAGAFALATFKVKFLEIK